MADHTGDLNSIWHRQHSNFWFEESLCEAASIFALRAMSRKWKYNPPYPNWADYAPCLSDYAEEIIKRPVHQLPAGFSFLDWFSKNEQDLRANCKQRDKNGLIAIRLLRIFETEPSLWETTTYLNRGSRDMNLPFASYLSEWKAMSPRRFHVDLVSLARDFGVEI